MTRKEVNECANLVARAFDDYDYFTLYFKEDNLRHLFQQRVIRSEFATNLKAAHMLVGRLNGEIVAVCQLHAPDHKKPSDLAYLLHGFGKVYTIGNKTLVKDWLNMDANASEPCHNLKPNAWYISSLAIDPNCKRQGIGSLMLNNIIRPYVKQHGGIEICLFTNSEENCRFYEKNGYTLFHQETITYNHESIGSWSYATTL